MMRNGSDRDGVASGAERYTTTAIVLHWAVAVLVFGMLGLGYRMVGIPPATPARGLLFNLHKSVGLLVLLLVVVRIGWRRAHRPPPLPGTLPRWRVQAAHVAHQLLYAGTLLQPVTGFLGSAFGKHGVAFFGFALTPWARDVPAIRTPMVTAHHLIAALLVLLIGLHVATALKDLLFDGRAVWRRMLAGIAPR